MRERGEVCGLVKYGRSDLTAYLGNSLAVNLYIQWKNKT